MRASPIQYELEGLGLSHEQIKNNDAITNQFNPFIHRKLKKGET